MAQTNLRQAPGGQIAGGQTALGAPGAWVPCSRPTAQLVVVTFHNVTPNWRWVQWVSPDCQIVPAAVVAPGGGTLTLTTYVGTTWAYVDPTTGRPAGSTMLYAGERDAWVY